MSELTISLTEGQTAIVGYGSLLSAASLSRTLGRDYGGPFVTCHVEGWTRAWDVAMPNHAFYYEHEGRRIYPQRILYLNVRRDPLVTMNAVLFVLQEGDLESMDGREWIYRRQLVTDELRGVRVLGGNAVMYVARNEHILRNVTLPTQAAVRGSYIGMLEAALKLRDSAFQIEYDQSTEPIPRDLVIDDKLDPERPSPWLAAGTNYQPENVAPPPSGTRS